MKDQFNRELCDERHEEIKAKLSELKKISFGILILLLTSLIFGVAKGETVISSKVFSGQVSSTRLNIPVAGETFSFRKPSGQRYVTLGNFYANKYDNAGSSVGKVYRVVYKNGVAVNTQIITLTTTSTLYSGYVLDLNTVSDSDTITVEIYVKYDSITFASSADETHWLTVENITNVYSS